MSRRNSYNNDVNPFPGLYQPQYNYQSMYVDPINLDLVREFNKDKQARFDATTNAIAQTKAGLYDSETFDPKEKEAVIKRINDEFNRVYKDYSGDMSAAAGDVIKMIADVRRDEYFDINKYALEQQKQYQALKKQYGAEGVDFTKSFPSSLRDESGAFRGREAFAYDIVKDPGMEKKAADIWNDALQQASFEGGLYSTQGGKFLESNTRFGRGIDKNGKDQVDNKLDQVFNEYMSTPEGILRAKVVNELEGVPKEQVAGRIKLWLRDIGKARVAPESIKYDRVGNPDYRIRETDKDSNLPNSLMATSDATIPDAIGKSGTDLKRTLNDTKSPLQQVAKNKVIRNLYQSDNAKVPAYENVTRNDIKQMLKEIDIDNLEIYGRKYNAKSPASTYILANLHELNKFLKGTHLYELNDVKLQSDIDELSSSVHKARASSRSISVGTTTPRDASKSLKQLRSYYDDELDRIAGFGTNFSFYAFDALKDKNNETQKFTQYLQRLDPNKLVDIDENKDLGKIEEEITDNSYMGLNVLPGYGVVLQVKTGKEGKIRKLKVTDPSVQQYLINHYDEAVGGTFKRELENAFTIKADDPSKIVDNRTGKMSSLSQNLVPTANGYIAITKNANQIPFTLGDYFDKLAKKDQQDFLQEHGISRNSEVFNNPYFFKDLYEAVNLLGDNNE